MDAYHGHETYTKDDYPLSREQYKQNCINGKYDKFKYGKLLEVDVTEYDNIDYSEIDKYVSMFIEEKNKS